MVGLSRSMNAPIKLPPERFSCSISVSKVLVVLPVALVFLIVIEAEPLACAGNQLTPSTDNAIVARVFDGL